MDFQDVSPQLEKLAQEFQYREPPDFLVRLQEFITHILRAIADFLKQLRINLPGMADTSAVGNAMQVFIVAIGLVCLVAVLFLVWTRMKHLKNQARLAKRGAQSLEEKLDALGWRIKAEELANKEHFKEACRALYLSVIYLLDERQVLEFAPTRTNYEYWYALKGKESLRSGFKKLADLVEVMWFGNHQAQLQDYEFCISLFGSLEREVQSVAESLPKLEVRA